MNAISNCLTKGSDIVQARYSSLRRLIAKRLLENELSSIIRTVSGHKRNKIPQGSSQYQSLWQIADLKVASFCTNHSVARAEIEAQIPALKELEDLAQAPEPPKFKVKVFAGVLSGTVLTVLMGFGIGIIHFLYGLGLYWAQWFVSHL